MLSRIIAKNIGDVFLDTVYIVSVFCHLWDGKMNSIFQAEL